MYCIFIVVVYNGNLQSSGHSFSYTNLLSLKFLNHYATIDSSSSCFHESCKNTSFVGNQLLPVASSGYQIMVLVSRLHHQTTMLLCHPYRGQRTSNCPYQLSEIIINHNLLCVHQQRARTNVFFIDPIQFIQDITFLDFQQLHGNGAMVVIPDGEEVRAFESGLSQMFLCFISSFLLQ